MKLKFIFFKKAGRWLIKPVESFIAYINTSKSKTQFNNHNYDSKRLDENEKIIKKVTKLIEKRNLDSSKNKNVMKVINSLNENNTVVGVSGEQGAGKSSVITMATKDVFLPRKGTFNCIAILFLLIIKYLTPLIFFTVIRKDISRRIALRRWKYVNLNLWSLFGQRNLEEYSDIKKTAFERKVESVENNLTNSRTRISSIDIKSSKVSFIFIKKVIWRAIFSKIKKTNPFEFHLSNSLFYNSYSINSEKTKFRIILMNAISILFLSGVFYALIFVILNYTSGLEVKDNAGISVSSIFPASIFHLIFKKSVEGIVTKEENNFFVDPISNITIESFLRKISRNKTIILHISEIDRLHNEVGDSKFIRYIIESITMGYSVRNVNVIFEIDSNIEDAISQGDSFVDTKNKLFKSMVYVRSFDADTFIKYKGIEKDEKILMYEYFKELESYEYSGAKSWRAELRHDMVFNKFINKGYIKLDSGINIRTGFKSAFKPLAMDEFSFRWRDERVETTIHTSSVPEINFGEFDENEDSKIRTFILMTNPHMEATLPWYKYPFRTENYQKYFVDVVVPEIEDTEVFDSKLMGFIVVNLPDHLLRKTFSLKFDNIFKWSEDGLNIEYDSEKFFDKLPERIKKSILNNADPIDLMFSSWVHGKYKSERELFEPQAVLSLINAYTLEVNEFYDNIEFILVHFNNLTDKVATDVLKMINADSRLKLTLRKSMSIKNNRNILKSDFDMYINSDKGVEVIGVDNII